MRFVTSFTRGVRYPAPDVARGFMLLLIAVANVPVWIRSAVSPLSIGAVEGLSPADRGWVLIRAMLVDHRAYPLFALLFGFGLVTMINRRIASGERAYLESVTGGSADQAAPALRAWAREQATVDARRLVRRRGWWMVLFGAVHGVFFYGDIIGTYGLVAVIFAGWLARKHRKRAIAVSVLITLMAGLTMLSMGWVVTSGTAQGMGVVGAEDPTAGSGLPWFLMNPGQWLMGTPGTVLLSMVVPSVFIGARLADTDLLSHPERHRGLLVAVAVGGLGLGALGGLHIGLVHGGWADLSVADFMISEWSGLLAACGWLALLALYAGGPRPGGELHGLRRLASAVGRRSMTAYLSQTILFGLIFAVIPWLLGAELTVGEAAAAAIATGVWLATVVICLILGRRGDPGPFETLLRTAVARSARRRRIPAPPSMPLRSEPAAA
ncbi:DUF418 domain-containing protein [Actinomyces capricornis]|uniref:DUF418 domain-containing protein n=1 Tax=Actinomyces capricornis TaxID=2755559 RepID=A0ABM7U9F5_9ACTO|nr:DUF418 domain-containing protein [Actinomyces capricornis]BDA64051.1 hypothetical protein MANAM107_08850 [Actinomyces capricornis]